MVSRLLLLLGLLVVATPLQAEESSAQMRRGSWVAFTADTEILSATDAVVRKAEAGEVVRIRILRGEWAEVGSPLPDLAGGKVKVTALRLATDQEREAWVAVRQVATEEAEAARAPLAAGPTEEEEKALEAAELSAAALMAPARSPGPKFSAPVVGWFSAGREFAVSRLVLAPDGTPYFCGTVKVPVTLPTARGWKGAVPTPEDPESTKLVFLARMAPSLDQVTDFVVFSREEIAEIRALAASPDAKGIWVAATGVGKTVGGQDAGKSPAMLLQFSPDLQACQRVMAIDHFVGQLAIDPVGRPVALSPVKGQSGGSFLTRYFQFGRFERNWPEAPDGVTRRLRLDFSSAALAEGPFALWSLKGEKLPDFPTPIGPWGASANGGQPITWTNVAGGQNPIRGANLKPEAIVIGKDGRIYVSGTIPFHMGFPDFDPFLMCFSPEGKLLWTNCFLTGLLSEPDQKTQDLALDPVTGDVVVCYWQHGNNKETLLLDPKGWLVKFTGTNGNIKMTWIGRVDSASGQLKHSTYLYAQMPNSKNARWPDLNSVTTRAIGVDGQSRVYAAGGTTIAFPTTDNAYISTVTEYGGHPSFCVIKPDLSAPVYSTYLSQGQGGIDHMAVVGDGLALLIGSHQTEGTPLPVATGGMGYLSATPPTAEKDGTFLAIVPVPAEESGWAFR